MELPVVVPCIMMIVIGLSQGCSKLEQCNVDFRTGLEMAGIEGPESSAQYCAELRSYAQCVKKSTKACRGNLSYHSSISLIETLLRRFKCSQQNWGPAYKRPPSRPSRPNNICTYAPTSAGETREYDHCGIFGDPHLKTFGRVYQTCGTRGAWPLIDNKHVAVQVTNMPVVNTSEATATTKVTVIIKRNGCADEKTYEATSDAPLKPHFIDGTYETGPEGSVVIKETGTQGAEKVEIFLRYIDTKIVIRRSGEYLAFSCRTPREIAEQSDETEFQLCRSGCPTTQLLDIASSRGHQLSWQAALAKCTDAESPSLVSNEIKNNLTDQYLDWCVFDVMTTGKSDFITAAHSAQADALQLDPDSLHNRTVPLELYQMPYSSGAFSIQTSLCLVLFVMTTVYNLNSCSHFFVHT